HRPQHRRERTSQNKQRRGDDHQDFVLRHVRGKENAAESVERRDERDHERDPSAEKSDHVQRARVTHAPDADDVQRRADHEQRHDNRLPRPPRHHLSGIEMVMAGMRDEEKWWGEKPLTRRYAPPSPRVTGRGATVMGTAAVMGDAVVMRVAMVMRGAMVMKAATVMKSAMVMRAATVVRVAMVMRGATVTKRGIVVKA